MRLESEPLTRPQPQPRTLEILTLASEPPPTPNNRSSWPCLRLRCGGLKTASYLREGGGEGQRRLERYAGGIGDPVQRLTPPPEVGN